MKTKATNGNVSACAIAGSYVVLLGINIDSTGAQGLLGFAIQRTDHTENEQYWLKGFKTFSSTDPGYPKGSLVSTQEHPIQGFLWGDYTAKPNHDYTYRVVTVRGQPKNLQFGDFVEVAVRTENVDIGNHAIYFNRGVAGSQAYARRFNNRHPADVPDRAAWIWLSRGLEEALLAFIGQASAAKYGLRASMYEFQYEPALTAFGTAAQAGADVKIVYDAKPNAADYPDKANLAAIQKTGITDLTIRRSANPSYISHNKFIVLLEDGNPTQVWTGSTNLTDGGIFGHSNVGHIVRDPNVAARYLAYWEQLSGDPNAKDLRAWNEANSPVPDAPPANATLAVFSPRSGLQALEWYASLMDQASTAVFFTAAFGVNDKIQSVLLEHKDYLRYLVLETDQSRSKNDQMDAVRSDPNNRVAVGDVIGKEEGFGRFLRETVTGLNAHVRYIHTKYLVIDPLGSDPTVITGSANFSDASTKNNDENMLVIRGEQSVAHVYLGEFMRLFGHFYFRDYVATANADPNTASHLEETDSWTHRYFDSSSPKFKERVYFAG